MKTTLATQIGRQRCKFVAAQKKFQKSNAANHCEILAEMEREQSVLDKLERSLPVKLIPPDKKLCQAMIRSGCFPTAKEMFIIGPGKTERCDNKPVCIVTEKKPAKDKQRGSMSLCGKCFVNFIEAFGGNYADVEILKGGAS